MTSNWYATGGCGTTVSRSSPEPKRTGPRLIVSGRSFGRRLAPLLRDLGWEVHTVADGAEARRLAHRSRPSAVLLPAETDGESGFLTCAKLRQCLPRLRVVLVGRERTPEAARFADFVGAALATEASVVDELHRLVLGALSEN